MRFFCLASGRKFKVKSPGGLGHGIRNRKGAEETYYFLSIDIHPQGSVTRVSSKFIHHLNGPVERTVNF